MAAVTPTAPPVRPALAPRRFAPWLASANSSVSSGAARCPGKAPHPWGRRSSQLQNRREPRDEHRPARQTLPCSSSPRADDHRSFRSGCRDGEGADRDPPRAMIGAAPSPDLTRGLPTFPGPYLRWSCPPLGVPAPSASPGPAAAHPAQRSRHRAARDVAERGGRKRMRPRCDGVAIPARSRAYTARGTLPEGRASPTTTYGWTRFPRVG